MGYIMRLNEYFDSIELRDSSRNFDKKSFIDNNTDPKVNKLLAKLLAENDYLSNFDSEIVRGSLSFYNTNPGADDDFDIHVTYKNPGYELLYGFPDDDFHEYESILNFTEDQILNMFRTKIKSAFDRYNKIGA